MYKRDLKKLLNLTSSIERTYDSKLIKHRPGKIYSVHKDTCEENHRKRQLRECSALDRRQHMLVGTESHSEKSAKIKIKHNYELN